ncbi:putative replication initiation protein [Lytechinus variegatus variable sea urchin associated circular virus]|uniref:putative replication initiation protein n=1 Tax=Lytechinus variegatus variable sea urchin associated circular virus TaxID=1692254 RepID=UPI0006A70A68|nr:putative replication initiation protein [Lytechinus variegatus variable sea urchin associated circular virus]AKV62302.1 putative replication initiation protein [Lytechinus variegatus variable sea urchin associated circular virus]
MPSFRVCAKNFFLTYPRSIDLSKQDLFDFLLSFEPNYLLVAEEKHADGTPHLHALLCLARRRDIRDPRHFDCQGYHCNITSTRSIARCIDYCKKDDCSPLSSGDVPGRDGWGAICECGTREDFMGAVRRYYPRDYVLNYEKLLAYADAHFNANVPYEPQFTDFVLPTEVDDWLTDNFKVRGENAFHPTGGILIGPVVRRAFYPLCKGP